VKRNLAFLMIILMALAMMFGNCSSGGSKPVELWNGKDFTGWKLFIPGDSVDVNTVWMVKNGVVHCSGVPNGYMRTEAEYENYELNLEWRWVTEPGNSGVLLHIQGGDAVWPKCLEAQLKADNAGDFVLMGPSTLTVDGEKHDSTERFHGIPKKQESNEKPVGQWNSYRIVCEGNDVTLYVNGLLQNAGTAGSYSRGTIGLQSEGAPIEFRNITLESLGN